MVPENVGYAMNLKGIKGEQACRQAPERMDAEELSGRSGNLPRDLSRGQEQRVGLEIRPFASR